MNIGIISDVHTEFCERCDEIPVCDTLICAGDLGLFSDMSKRVILEQFMLECKNRADNVIVVLGNHEFYNTIYSETLQEAKEFYDRLGIHLLDIELGTQDLVIDGVKFWGTTFWTDFKNNSPTVHMSVGDGLNDFYIIKTEQGETFTTEDAYNINKRSRDLINWDADVIITHHCPIDIKHPRFETSNMSYGFVNTGLEQKITDSNVKLWVYGHNHWSQVDTLGGTIVASNQYGYRSYIYKNAEDTNFDPNMTITI